MADGNSIWKKGTKLYLLVKLLRFSAGDLLIHHACWKPQLLLMLCVWSHFKESKNWQGFQALRDGIYLTLLQALFEGHINIIAFIPNNRTVRWVLLLSQSLQHRQLSRLP